MKYRYFTALLVLAGCTDGSNRMDAGELITDIQRIDIPIDRPETTQVDAVDTFDVTGEDRTDVSSLDSDSTINPDTIDDATDVTDVVTDTVLVGPCTLVGTGLTRTDPLQIPRMVHTAIMGNQFVASTLVSNNGVNNIFVHRLNETGSIVDQGNLSTMAGAFISGGAIFSDSTSTTGVFSSNSNGALDVFARRMNSMNLVVGSSLNLVMDDEASEEAMIVRAGDGFNVVWRNTVRIGTATRLMAAHVTLMAPDTLMLGTVHEIVPTTIGPSMFDMVSTSNETVIAYIEGEGAGRGNVSVLALDQSGNVRGTPVTVGGNNVATSVAMAANGSTLAVVWAERALSSAFRGRTVTATNLSLGQSTELMSLGTMVSSPGITADGSGWALAFRAPDMMGGSTGIVRMSSSLAITEGISRVDTAVTGDRVRISARGDGFYVVGWSDQSTSGSTMNARVMRCP